MSIGYKEEDVISHTRRDEWFNCTKFNLNESVNGKKSKPHTSKVIWRYKFII